MTHSISFITETIKDFSSSCNPSLLLIPVFSALLHLPLFPVFIIYSFSAGSLICFSLHSHRHILSLSPRSALASFVFCIFIPLISVRLHFLYLISEYWVTNHQAFRKWSQNYLGDAGLDWHVFPDETHLLLLSSCQQLVCISTCTVTLSNSDGLFPRNPSAEQQDSHRES